MSRPGRWAAASFLLGAWGLFFAGHLLSDGVPYYRDNLLTNLPIRDFLRARLLSGELPQWYPYESLGIPFMGQLVTGTFHPATWLLLPLEPLIALKLNLLLAYLIGAVGAYRLARLLPASRSAAACAAVAFAFGGYALGVSSIVVYTMSQATLPWVAWAALRAARRQRLKDAALLGGAWALVFYAGDAQGFLLCGLLPLLVLVEGVSRRRLALLALGGIVAALLCCLELLPSMALAAQSIRVQGQPSPTLGLTWALHPLRLPELLVPGYIPEAARSRMVGELVGGGTATTTVFVTTLFAGGIVLLLAAAGLASARRLALAFAALGAFALWLALGDRGELLPLVKRVLPLFKSFRYPEKYLAFFWLALCPLVAFGHEHARARLSRWSAFALAFGAAVGGLGLAVAWHGLAAAVWSLAGHPLAAADPVSGIVDEAWSHGLFWTGLFGVMAGLVLLAARKRERALLLLPVLIFAELWQGNGQHLPLVPRALFEAGNPFASAIRDTAAGEDPPGRVLREVESSPASTVVGPELVRERWVASSLLLLRPDVSGLYGVPTLGDNLAGVSVRYASVFGAKPNIVRLGGFFNGCFRVVEPGRKLVGEERLLGVEESLGLALVGSPCWPRAFLAGTRPVANLREAMAQLAKAAPTMDAIVWEKGPLLARASGRVRWLTSRPEHLALEVEADAPTALVITDELTEGWSATVDGAPVPLYPTLAVVRGLPVPAGRHRVEMLYQTPRLLPGALGTGLGGLLLLGLLAASGLEERRRGAFPPVWRLPEVPPVEDQHGQGDRHGRVGDSVGHR